MINWNETFQEFWRMDGAWDLILQTNMGYRAPEQGLYVWGPVQACGVSSGDAEFEASQMLPWVGEAEDMFINNQTSLDFLLIFYQTKHVSELLI